MPPLALLRGVPASFAACLARRPPVPPLDPERARAQHAAYRARLEEGGFRTVMLAADEAHPDCPFVEDTAVVLEGAALVTRPGHPSRRGEVKPVGEALAALGLSLVRMHPPATLDGGDVLQAGGCLFVGESERSNPEGRRALERFAAPRGWGVVPVPLRGVLHLKSAAGALDERTVLVFPDAVGVGAWRGLQVVTVGGDDPEAANVVRLPDGRVLVAAHLPAAAAAVAAAGFTPLACDVSEFARADGGLTCLSLRLRRPQPPGAP